MKRFSNETTAEIMEWLKETVATASPGDIITFTIPDPDMGAGLYSGTIIEKDGREIRHRNWKAWMDLAGLFRCRMLTPRISGPDEVDLRFQKLDPENSFHESAGDDITEKYGAGSRFSDIRKSEEPSLLFHFRKSLQEAGIESRHTILDLGINSGDELGVIKSLLGEDLFGKKRIIGIDHSRSAIDQAEQIYNEENVTFYCHDINRLDALSLPKADLLISIGTLQSPGIDFKPLFMSLIQNYLAADGAVILGFPNSRWMDGELLYGARVPHYNFPEMSLVIKDIYFCKKYLQQHRFRVRLTGKEYLFLTATKIGKRAN